MRLIDWRKILDENRIEYVERGPNVKRGELNIRCPFCGSADPSHHMGLNLTTGWWACWRNENHRGKSPVRLLVQLLRISYWKARELAGLDDDYVDPDGFDAVAARIMGREKLERVEEVRREFLKFPKEFQSLATKNATGTNFLYRRHISYLESRGFPKRDLNKLCVKYDLQAAMGGSFNDRIILPYFLNQELVTWTGRAITRATIRYKDLAIQESLVPAKQTLFNHDAIIEGGNVLLVVEGPMDVLKFDFYGEPNGLRAVGLSTSSITDNQMYMLEQATSQFNRVIIMLDTISKMDVVATMQLRDQIAHIPKLDIAPVPYGYKDGGEMPPRFVVKFAREVVK